MKQFPKFLFSVLIKSSWEHGTPSISQTRISRSAVCLKLVMTSYSMSHKSKNYPNSSNSSRRMSISCPSWASWSKGVLRKTIKHFSEIQKDSRTNRKSAFSPFQRMLHKIICLKFRFLFEPPRQATPFSRHWIVENLVESFFKTLSTFTFSWKVSNKWLLKFGQL